MIIVYTAASVQCTVPKLHVNSLTHGLRLTLQYCASPSPSEVKRSSSMMSSHPLKTDDTIALVTEKVRKMDARFVSKMQLYYVWFYTLDLFILLY